MTDQTADRPVSLTELEIRSELFDAMDGNLRMSRRRELLAAYRDAVLAAAEPEPRTFADGGVNDIRQLYAVQGAITDAGGELTRPVHKAIDALREVWDRELRREQQRNVAVVSAPVQPTTRTDVYAEVAEIVRSMAPEHPRNASWVQDCHHIADRIDERRAELRRMAGEEQPATETQHTGGNAEDCPVCRPEIDKTVLYPWICQGEARQDGATT